MSKQDEVIEACKKIAVLPDGYTMKINTKTRNILVCGPNLGFCISERAMDEGHYLESFKPCLEFLIEKEAEYLKDPDNPCWHIKVSHKLATIEPSR
jgi:hypothetical protein